jgi:hypothetical protein
VKYTLHFFNDFAKMGRFSSRRNSSVHNKTIQLFYVAHLSTTILVK